MLLPELDDVSVYERLRLDELEKRLSPDDVDLLHRIVARVDTTSVEEELVELQNDHEEFYEDVKQAQTSAEEGVSSLQSIIYALRKTAEDGKALSSQEIDELANEIDEAVGYFDDLSTLDTF